MKARGRRRSFKQQLVMAFFVTSMIPIISIFFISYFNSTNILKDNMDALISSNLEQTRNSLDIWMESYEDLIYQIYTDDTIVELVDRVNREENLALSINQLQRSMRAIRESKAYIESITIFTESGEVINCDSLTSVTTENSWLDSFSLSQEELYEEVAKDNRMHVFSTEYAATFANRDYYLFHIAHRIIDYRNILKKSGVVVMSIDEQLLRDICLDQESDGMTFIVDDDYHIVSYPEQDLIGREIATDAFIQTENITPYRPFIENRKIFDAPFEVYQVHDDTYRWTIVKASTQSTILNRIIDQRKLFLLVFLCFLIALGLIIVTLMNRLTKSMNVVVNTMEKTQHDGMPGRVPIDETMPREVEVIASTYNHMIEELKASMVKEKDAEIKALEAQINPHFLYNTLDTINWMAIDKDDYDISNAISSLAVILRYGIDRSNEKVTLRDEMEWLKKYIYLQQTRMKDNFECDIHVDTSILETPIHKLLLLPFIENSIVHGFQETRGKHYLRIAMERKGAWLHIEIEDNGIGIEPEMVTAFNERRFESTDDKNHIGMENAILRIHMYYGERARVHIESEPGKGTTIYIEIDIEGEQT